MKLLLTILCTTLLIGCASTTPKLVVEQSPSGSATETSQIYIVAEVAQCKVGMLRVHPNKDLSQESMANFIEARKTWIAKINSDERPSQDYAVTWINTLVTHLQSYDFDNIQLFVHPPQDITNCYAKKAGLVI